MCQKQNCIQCNFRTACEIKNAACPLRKGIAVDVFYNKHLNQLHYLFFATIFSSI